MDRTTGKVTIIRSFLNPDSQVVSIAGDGDWVAWVEASLQPSFADWTLYSYDRRTGQIRTLAAAPKPYQNTPYVAISMSHGVVVWSAVESSDEILRVYAINADGSGLRVVAQNARGPQIVWPWIVYAVKPVAPGSPSHLVRENLQTGELKQIVGPSDVSYFAYDGEALAWIPGNTNHIYLQAPINSTPIELYPGNGRYFQFPTLNQRLVGWGQDQGAFVYDRKLGEVVQLSNLYDFYPVMSDQALDWLDQPNPNAANPFDGTVWREINVSDLP